MMLFRKARPFAGALLAATTLLAACSAPPEAAIPAAPIAAPAAPAAAPAAPMAAAPAVPAAMTDTPTLKIKTFDGQDYDLAAHRGHWVVVNFWATWCTPCLKEIPDLAEFDRRHDDVEVIGLSYEEIERADMEAFLKEHAIPYPIAIVDVVHPPADFETPPGLPMTYLIAPDGKVAKKFLGPITSQDLTKAMDEHGKVQPAAA